MRGTDGSGTGKGIELSIPSTHVVTSRHRIEASFDREIEQPPKRKKKRRLREHKAPEAGTGESAAGFRWPAGQPGMTKPRKKKKTRHNAGKRWDHRRGDLLFAVWIGVVRV